MPAPHRKRNHAARGSKSHQNKDTDTHQKSPFRTRQFQSFTRRVRVWKPFYRCHNSYSTCYLPCVMDVGPTPTPKHTHKPSAWPTRPRFQFWVWGGSHIPSHLPTPALPTDTKNYHSDRENPVLHISLAVCLTAFQRGISRTLHATSPVQWMWDPPHTQTHTHTNQARGL